MKDWFFDSPWPMAATTALIIGILVFFMVRENDSEQREWTIYAAQHHCIANGTKRGQVSTGFGPVISSKGGVAVVTTVTPDQTIYTCDGGEIQIR